MTAARIDTLVFDVLGTVVDESGTIAGETVESLAPYLTTAQATAFAARWSGRADALLDDIRDRKAEWRSSDALRAAALKETLSLAGLAGIPSDTVDQLARVGDRLEPWPDCGAGLGRLADSFGLVALSNGTMRQLFELSRHGGLRWHAVLSAEMVRAYKPDPAMYRMALESLRLDPQRAMMVACHPWDLRAAASHGLRTAYVSRPDAELPSADDSFDIQAADFIDLADQLASTVG